MNIRSVGQALTWEYWRRGMLWFVPACIGLFLVGLFLLAVVTGVRLPLSAIGAELRGGLVPFVIAIAAVLSLASWTAIRRHYVLPITTSRLVAWSLASGGLAALAMYLATACILNGVLRADLPLLLPALGCLALYAGFQALLWWVGPSRGVLVLSVTVLLALGKATDALWGFPTVLFTVEEFPREARDLTGGQMATWVATLILSWGLAVNGVARDRRGAAWSLAWLARGSAAVIRRIASWRVRPAGISRFRSAAAAQFWSEWRTKGRWLPWTTAGGLVVLGVYAWPVGVAPHDLASAIDVVTMALLLASPFLGLWYGGRSRSFDVKSFVATRPLSDGALALAVLRNAAASLGITAAVWLGGMLLLLATCLPERWESLRSAWERNWLEVLTAYANPVVVPILVGWTLAGLGTALALARSWFIGCVGFGLVAAFIGLGTALSHSPAEVSEYVLTLLAVTFWGATIAAFIAARRRRLVSTRTIVGCVIGYFLLLAYCYALRETEQTWTAYAAVIAVSVLPLAPFAAAPLALSWNRHR